MCIFDTQRQISIWYSSPKLVPAWCDVVISIYRVQHDGLERTICRASVAGLEIGWARASNAQLRGKYEEGEGFPAF